MTKRQSLRRAAMSGILLCAGSALASSDKLTFDDGNWDISIYFRLGNDAHTEESSLCMTPEEASITPRDIAVAFAGGASCEAETVSQSENNVSFQLTCPAPNPIHSADLTLVHAPSEFEIIGPVKLRVSDVETMDSHMVMTANHTGPCKAPDTQNP